MFSKLNKIINKDNLKIIHVEAKKWRNFTSTFRYNTILAEQILACRCHRENFRKQGKLYRIGTTINKIFSSVERALP